MIIFSVIIYSSLENILAHFGSVLMPRKYVFRDHTCDEVLSGNPVSLGWATRNWVPENREKVKIFKIFNFSRFFDTQIRSQPGIEVQIPPPVLH